MEVTVLQIFFLTETPQYGEVDRLLQLRPTCQLGFKQWLRAEVAGLHTCHCLITSPVASIFMCLTLLRQHRIHVGLICLEPFLSVWPPYIAVRFGVLGLLQIAWWHLDGTNPWRVCSPYMAVPACILHAPLQTVQCCCRPLVKQLPCLPCQKDMAQSGYE